ncbi:MAG: hypothetical protein U0V04_15930 [Spirosomataceae bacterium]|jgi:hypothetical protein
MKNSGFYKSVIGLLFLTILGSCTKEEIKESNPDIGGTTNLGINTVGNQFYGSLKMGDTYFTTNESIKIASNDDGVLSITAKTNAPVNHPLYKLIPDKYKTATGLSGTFKIKSTSEGIQDFFNKDEKAFTLVKFDAKVGDKYIIKKSDGTFITREVIQRSEKDDYPYGFYDIKVITVEQDSRIPGVSKILYRVNHKFGIVNVEFKMEDGSTNNSYIFSKITN